MSESKSDALLGGMIIGAAIGAVAGILAAPRPGRDTRRILKKSADALPELAEDLATSVQFQADRLSATSLSNWDQTLGRLREAVVAGRAASRQEWQRQQSYATAHTSSIQTEIDPETSATVSNDLTSPPVSESVIRPEL